MEIGTAKYAGFAPDDLAGLKAAFLDGIPDAGRMFPPGVLRSDADSLDIKFHACPLREAWQESRPVGGRGRHTLSHCRAVDNGTFEGAGFQFQADTWQPGGEGCCCLHIRRKQ